MFLHLAELMSLSKDNAIESFYLCYFLSPCLSTNECVNGDSVNVNGASSSASMSHFNSSLLLKESSPSKHNTNISSIQHNDMAKLQSLLKEYFQIIYHPGCHLREP